MAPLRLVAAAAVAIVSLAPRPASAQQHIALPQVNLGSSSFMDGAGGPGLLLREALALVDAPRFAGPNGETIPASQLVAFSAITHVGYTLPFKVLGGFLGAEILVPIVHVDITTPVGKGSTTGVGDIAWSLLVYQAPDLMVLGRPFLHRLDADVIAPTGQYDRTALTTPGAHVWSLNPYYAFTWLFTEHLETSWRLHYLWSSTNGAPGPGYAATSIQPGQAIHVNGAVSYGVTRAVRAGVAGYVLQQLTDSRADGHAIAGSRERVVALGPGFLATAGGVQMFANAYAELAVENRPAGARLAVSALRVW
jgi:hypothetical protein